MAPSRPYMARISEPNGEPEYVPIVRNPERSYTLSRTLGILEPTRQALDDSRELLGTQIDGDRPATLGDLRAGRAADIYWEIRGPNEARAFWKTPTAIRWPTSDTSPTETGTFAFSFVVQAEARQGTLSVLVVQQHARTFRAAVLKAAKSPEEPKEPSKKRNKSPKKIDLERTDKPVDFSHLYRSAFETVSY